MILIGEASEAVASYRSNVRKKSWLEANGSCARSFDAYGKMDPFTVVEWLEKGSRREISRTRIDWNADMHPHWDHSCRGQPFKMGCRAEVQFQAGLRVLSYIRQLARAARRCTKGM